MYRYVYRFIIATVVKGKGIDKLHVLKVISGNIYIYTNGIFYCKTGITY